MKKITFLLLLFPVLFLSQNNFEYKRDFEKILQESKKKNSELSSSKLLERYIKADTTLTDKQVLALLINFTDNAHYKPYKDLEFSRNLYKLNEEEKFNQAITEGEKFLSNHPFDLKTLDEVAYAYYKKDNLPLSDSYQTKADLIFKAMIYSGDGTSIDTPMFALNPSDGQDFIKKVFEAKIGSMGSGRDKNGYFIDMLEIQEGEKKQMMYFIIPHATKKMFD